MAGYTRQSAASIINGENITAPPLNAEFNQLESSFNDTTGHAHDGTTGNGPKIDLTTSITGFLPAEHGGFGGKNNYVATTNPGVGDDTNDGYAVGSVWYNVPDDRYWVCVYAAAGAAVWLENRFIDTNGDIAPFATDTVDLGATLKRFKDLFLSGNADIDGTLNVATTAYVGGTLTVAGSTLLNGDVTLGNSATDDINVTARFKDDLVPGTDDTYDLGSSTLQWRNIWIDGTANIDTLDVHENATVTGTLGVTGDATFANLDATGTTTITSVDLNSGAIDNATIGATTPAAATVTTLTSTGLATLASVDVNGGNVDNTVIGGTTPAAGTFTNLTSSGTSTHASVDINGGNIDATVIGASSAAAGSFTSLTTSGQATLATVDINGGNIDGAAIGSTTTSSGAFTTLSASGGITGTLTGNVTGNVTGDITGDVTGDLTGNVTASSGSSSFNNVTINGSLNMNAGTSATITNLTAPVNTLDAATKGYVDTSIANLVDSAPGTLDTLNELAAALGDDPNFSTTITNSIATKLSLNGGTMAGDIAMGSNSITGMADPAAAQDAATKNYTDTTFLALSGGTMTGAVDMGSNKVTSSAAPSTGNDLTNKTYVDGVLGSATAASASAAAAATSETNAATSEANAANSATAAASSATSAAASLDSFDDRYLGAKATAPTVDNDGDALITGALYFDTTTDTMKVYGSSGWVNAGSSVNGTSDRQTYTATAGQTVFAATYDAGYVDVYLNGVKLLAGTDFTATNGTSITLASGAAVNDIVDIVAYGTFVLADHLTETQSDARYVQQTHTGNVSVTGAITSTDRITGDGSEAAPAFRFTSDTNTGMFPPAGGDALGFSTGGSEAARFDSSGDFLIGTTDKTLYDETSGGLEGFVFRTDGRMYNSRDGGTNAIFNRLTSDGDIMQFRRDGTTVGSIGSTNFNGSKPFIANPQTNGAGLGFYTNAIFPTNSSGAPNNGVVDLGIATYYKFKDLHLSGTANAGSVDVNQPDYSHFKVNISGPDSGPATSGATGTGALYIENATNDVVLTAGVKANSDRYGWLQMTNRTNYSSTYNLALQPNGGYTGVGTTNPVATFAVSNGGASGIEFQPEISTNFNRITNYNRSASVYNELGVDAARIEIRPEGVRRLSVATSGVIVNEDSRNDTDFRVESDSNANMLFVDASTNSVGIATGSPSSNCALTVGGSAGDGTPPLFVNSTIAAASTFNYVFQGHVTDLPNGKRTAFSVGKAHNAYNQTIMGHYHAGDGSTSNYGFLGMHNADDAIIWNTSKEVGIAISPSARLHVLGEVGTDTAIFRNGSDAGNGISLQRTDGTEVGSINWASSSTSFNTSSDHRLKENVITLSDGITRVKQLQPKRFSWIIDEQDSPTVDGFLAHEAQTVVPEAVTGTHNEVDDEGNPVYQGIDQAKLVPLLTAALQEAITKIEDLEARVAALET